MWLDVGNCFRRKCWRLPNDTSERTVESFYPLHTENHNHDLHAIFLLPIYLLLHDHSYPLLVSPSGWCVCSAKLIQCPPKRILLFVRTSRLWRQGIHHPFRNDWRNVIILSVILLIFNSLSLHLWLTIMPIPFRLFVSPWEYNFYPSPNYFAV